MDPTRKLTVRSFHGTFRTSFCALFVPLFLISCPIQAGIARTENFVVVVAAEDSAKVNKEVAAEIARKADSYRASISTEWLGEELPPSVGRTYLSVLISKGKSDGRTFPTTPQNENHVHLQVDASKLTGGALAHEIAHTVVASRYPGSRIAPWVMEGIASRYDDESRKKVRDRIIRFYIKTGNWPSLRKTIESKQIQALDRSSYAVSESLVAFLLSRNPNKPTMLKFADEAQVIGWTKALKKHYKIESFDSLQQEWQAWLSQGKIIR